MECNTIFWELKHLSHGAVCWVDNVVALCKLS